MEVVWNSNLHIIYHTWQNELESELAVVEAKDQKLADLIVDVSMFYKSVDDAAPPM